MPRIFISYRRADSITITGRIHDHLVNAFGAEYIFKDVDDIPLGADFRQVLDQEVGSCDVLLVIIGQDWASITDAEDQPRLHDPDDFVRIEVESGLKREDVQVIPVMVMGTGLPKADQLPESLRPLVFRNAATVREDPDFNRDMNKLIRDIRRWHESQEAPAAPPQPAPSRRAVWTTLGLAAVAVLVVGVLLINGLSGEATPTTPTETVATSRPTSAATDTVGATRTTAPVETPEATGTITLIVPKPADAGIGEATTAMTRMPWINVRGGPGTDYEDIGDILKYSDVIYYPDSRTYQGWVWVEHADLAGWVNTEFVTFVTYEGG